MEHVVRHSSDTDWNGAHRQDHTKAVLSFRRWRKRKGDLLGTSLRIVATLENPGEDSIVHGGNKWKSGLGGAKANSGVGLTGAALHTGAGNVLFYFILFYFWALLGGHKHDSSGYLFETKLKVNQVLQSSHKRLR